MFGDLADASYVVSRMGTTGVNNGKSANSNDLKLLCVKELDLTVTVFIAVGFGVSNPDNILKMLKLFIFKSYWAPKL